VDRWAWDASVASELAVRFAGWTRCVEAADPTALDEYLHPDFLYVTVFGLRLDKPAYLDMVSRIAPGGRFEIHRTSARVRGDVAELDGEYYTGGGLRTGEDLSAHTRFTATWVRDSAGTWRCLTHHGTRYEPARSGD